MCHQRCSTKADAHNMINWTVVCQLCWQCMQLFWYLYVHSVEDSTLMSIFDQFCFSFVSLGLPKIGPNSYTWLLLVARARAHTHTHTHPFNGPLSGTTRVSGYQKGKTNLDFTEARDSEWQWHQLGHMQVCISLQTDNHASTPPLVFYRPDALPAAQPTTSKHWRRYLLVAPLLILGCDATASSNTTTTPV